MTAAIERVLDSTEARAPTDQIKTGVETVWHLITHAYTERAWTALGYTSWDDYCTREFGTSRLRLPREERAEVVSSLRESGLSPRAIASATGLARNTVTKELDQVAHIKPPSEPEPVAAEPDAVAQCIHCGETLPLSKLYEGGQGYECDPCVSPDSPADKLAAATEELGLYEHQELPPLPENYMDAPGAPAGVTAMAVGDLIRRGGQWLTEAPTHCPNGHELGPGQVLVGHGGGGHTIWHCRTCATSPLDGCPMAELSHVRFLKNAAAVSEPITPDSVSRERLRPRTSA
jgi:hypothetical protein